MILAKTPFRISFVGGGSDHFNYASQVPGRIICTTIDKFIYVAVNKKHDDKVRLSYSITENVYNVESLHGPVNKILNWNDTVYFFQDI